MAPRRKAQGKNAKHGKGGSSKKASSKDSGKRARNSAPEAPVKLYTATDLILVLGDGDFTFSKGLVKHRGTGDGLLATSFDSESTVRSKYANAHQCINDIRSAKGRVLHDVDATKLDELPLKLKDGAYVPSFFKFILFNFPHSGQQRVHINRALLRDFFESARSRLFKNGEVHVTLKTKPPYSNWLIEEQAKAADFVLKERRKFNIKLFPGYNHRTTDPTAKAFEPDLCVTYVFIVNRTKHPFEAIAQAQRLKQRAEASSAPIPQAEAENTAIAQLLQAHAKAKAEQAAASTKPVPVASNMSKKVSAPVVEDEEDDSEPEAAEVVEKKKKKKHRGLWTPLHRRSTLMR